jgi:carboxyl-terminal processing protease
LLWLPLWCLAQGSPAPQRPAGEPPGGTPAQQEQIRQLDIESFEYVWKTIRDKHWDPNLGGLDWQAVYREYHPKIEQAKSPEEARELMNQMLARLGQSHFVVVPSVVYHELARNKEEYEDYPAGAGEPGLDVRVIDRQALVTRVDPGSPAAACGVRLGWEVMKVGDQALGPVIDRISQTYRNSTLLDFHLRRAVLARMSGPIGEKVPFEFVDGANKPVDIEIAPARPRGNRAGFGNLSPQFVWFESRRVDGNIGYIAFNLFLDPPGVMKGFGDAVQSCMSCAGMIIDLRGNPGGIGGMSMGMAGWFISKPDQRLGTMYMRGLPLKFVVIPRVQIFSGPLAILVDGCSVSTSEILAGGLKDLGRARVFGTRTGAAALPSVFEKLPNGDGFQYAIGNYISEGGKPLEGLGVIPDVVVVPTREALLKGQDPVMDAAKAWIQAQKGADKSQHGRNRQ